MATIWFPAIIERGSGGGLGVVFPDLPGCTSGGDTEQEAAENAAEALRLHLRGMLEDGDTVPEPSRIDAIANDPDVEEVCRLLVPVEGGVRGEDVSATPSP